MQKLRVLKPLKIIFGIIHCVVVCNKIGRVHYNIGLPEVIFVFFWPNTFFFASVIIDAAIKTYMFYSVYIQ